MKKTYILITSFVLLVIVCTFNEKLVKAEDKAILTVTGSSTVKAYVVADGTFANGWKWTLDVTVPSDETVVQMKFADLLSSLGSIPAKDNIQFYSNQSSNAFDANHAVVIKAKDAYSDPMYLATDASGDTSSALGKQIRLTIEARAPAGSIAGDYAMNYGILTNTEIAASSTINKPPVAASRFIVPAVGAPVHYYGDDVRIPIADILAAASDPNGDALHLTNVSSPSSRGATITIVNTDILYHPSSSATLDTDNFSYTIDDARGGTATGVVLVTGTARP